MALVACLLVKKLDTLKNARRGECHPYFNSLLVFSARNGTLRADLPLSASIYPEFLNNILAIEFQAGQFPTSRWIFSFRPGIYSLSLFKINTYGLWIGHAGCMACR